MIRLLLGERSNVNVNLRYRYNIVMVSFRFGMFSLHIAHDLIMVDNEYIDKEILSMHMAFNTISTLQTEKNLIAYNDAKIRHISGGFVMVKTILYQKIKESTLDLLCNYQMYNRGSAVALWLMPWTPDPEVGGSSPTRVKPCCVLEQGTFTPQKYW